MNRSLSSFFVAIVATTSFSMACSGKSPTGETTLPTPSPSPSPTPAPTTVSLAGLPVEVQDYVLTSTMSTIRIQRFGDDRNTTSNAVRVSKGPFSEALVLQAIAFWEARIPTRFRVVATEEEGEIDLTAELPKDPNRCGDFTLLANFPLLLGGRAIIGVGLRPDKCFDRGTTLVSVITHEVGHILGFGHTPPATDNMSPDTWGMIGSPRLDGGATFIYNSPLGAIVTR